MLYCCSSVCLSSVTVCASECCMLHAAFVICIWKSFGVELYYRDIKSWLNAVKFKRSVPACFTCNFNKKLLEFLCAKTFKVFSKDFLATCCFWCCHLDVAIVFCAAASVMEFSLTKYKVSLKVFCFIATPIAYYM